MRSTSHLVFFLALQALALSAGCGRQPEGNPGGKAADAKKKKGALSVVTPRRVTLHKTVVQPGSIRAYEETPVYTKIAGFVGKWLKDAGADVQAGEVLAELWVPEMEVEVRQKAARVAEADAKVVQANQSLAASESALISAEARVRLEEASRLRAKAELERARAQYQGLIKVGKKGVVNREVLDDSRFAFEAAEAGVAEVEARVQAAAAFRDESRSKLDKAAADITVAEAWLRVAKENRTYAETLLKYATVTAPFAGVVTHRNVDTGAFVQAATGAKGDPLFVVARTKKMRVFVEVPEADAGWVKVGDAARVRVQVLRGETFPGKVSRTSWSLDRTSRTLLGQIDLDNSDGILRPGMYAHVILDVALPNVLALPKSAVVTQGDISQGYETFFYLVEDDKAKRLPVEVGYRDDRHVEVLRKQTRLAQDGQPARWEPFTGQEQVLAGDLSGVTDGQPVSQGP
jgi:multidrug efflux pump subunit AcrA (membrane-fusion protein)